MGSSSRAPIPGLNLLQAIDFAKEQNDDDLWEDLLRYSETRPSTRAPRILSWRVSDLTSFYTRIAGERWCRHRPNSTDPPYQKRARDSWSQTCIDQNSAGLQPAALAARWV